MTEGYVPRQLGAILDILNLNYDSLFEPDPDCGKKRERVVAWLYRILDTLDSKTSHLLRFASLLLAAQTFLAGLLVRGLSSLSGQVPGLLDNRVESAWVSGFVLVLLLFPLLAAVVGLNVFRVAWLFFEMVRKPGEVPRGEEGIKDELRELARVCDERANSQRWTFFLCILAAAAFFVTVLVALSVVYPYWAAVAFLAFWVVLPIYLYP